MAGTFLFNLLSSNSVLENKIHAYIELKTTKSRKMSPHFEPSGLNVVYILPSISHIRNKAAVVRGNHNSDQPVGQWQVPDVAHPLNKA